MFEDIFVVFRIWDIFIPDPADFHSGTRILPVLEGEQIFKTVINAFHIC
jgi:hypothetical protein